MNFDPVEEQGMRLARGVNASSRGTMVVQVELEDLLPMRDVWSTFLRNYSSLMIIYSACATRGAGAPT